MTRSASARPAGGPARTILPLLLLPLSLIASCLASAPWLRAFPSSVLAAPLFGAALLSVLLPFVVISIGLRRLWLTALIDLVGFLFFVTLVALREPLGYPDLWAGIVHGPSQILTFALPLVSPRSLLVIPVALCWLCGAIVGECVGRAWQSLLPYLALFVTFGISYAFTLRASTDAASGRRFDTIIAGALLLCVLLLRAVQAWIDQDADVESAQPDGGLPLRSVAIGAVVAIVVAAAASALVQSSAFAGRAATPARIPPVTASDQENPLSFVAGLRPADPEQGGRPLFTVTVDRTSSRYIGLGDVDSYNGDSWSFSRTFRPSGGVIPQDPDPSLRPAGPPVAQQYTITDPALAASPWMPFQVRPQRIMGAGVDVDAASGMIVPSSGLRVGQRYSVVSQVAPRTVDDVRPSALPGTSYPAVDVQLPAEVTDSLNPVISALSRETGTPATPAIPFLQALADDFRTHYGLAGAPHRGSPSTAGGSASTRSPSARSGSRSSAPPSRSTVSPTPSATPSNTPSSAATGSTGTRVGGTSFAAVLASILGSSRTATPEQYATLIALVARQEGVPAVVETGFRLPTANGAATVAPGTYTVTTGDAWTWVDIPIRGQGWLALDAAPGNGTPHRSQQSTGPSPTRGASSAPPSNALVTRANTQVHQAAGPKGVVPVPHRISAGTVAVVVVIVVAALLVLLLALLLLRKALRVRARKRRLDPRGRVIGAWQETIDVLVESGLQDPSAFTTSELAAATDSTFGSDSAQHARAVGELADVAIFSPAAEVRPDLADAAWRAHTALRRTVRQRLGVAQRIRARLRYHRRTRSRPSAAARPRATRAGAATVRGRRGPRGRQRAH